MFEIPYCCENELVAKRFLHKFHEFTKNTYDVAIKWVTRKVKSFLFFLKDKNPYPSCVICEGNCMGKTTLVRLLETRQLYGMSMKTLKKTQNQQNTYEWMENTNLNGKLKSRKAFKFILCFYVFFEHKTFNFFFNKLWKTCL